MSNGKVVECGAPGELLKDEGSLFAQMAKVDVGSDL